MNPLRHLRPCAALVFAAPLHADDPLDRLGEALSFSRADGAIRAKVSGSADLEGYHASEPVSDLVFSDRDVLFNPRLTLFLDAQAGRRVYGFVQVRADRGFDPDADAPAQLRLDEYAVRFSPWEDGRLNVQAGQFATVVGNWTRRHLAWDNPFVTAPLPYENLTGVWDAEAVANPETLLGWAHVRPVSDATTLLADKWQRVPIIWGPSYATGVALSRASGPFEYAVELKNAALASRPETWNGGGDHWRHPTVSGRVAWRPNPAWTLGVSASEGVYLVPGAAAGLPAGRRLGDYRERVLAQDLAFAWHHFQLWAEVFAARFEIPGVGDSDTLAYYLEAKQKFTPQWYGALRWNQQFFGEIDDRAGRPVRWGREAWRLDVATGYRFTAHVQAKLQVSVRHDEPATRRLTHAVAAQLSVKF